jgi:hypothetical protein
LAVAIAPRYLPREEEEKTISATRGHYASALAYSIDLAQFQLDATVVISEPGFRKLS